MRLGPRGFGGVYIPENDLETKRRPIPLEDIRSVQAECIAYDDNQRWLIALISDTGMRLGKGHPGWFRPVPCAIIAGERPKVALLCLTPPRIKDGSWRLVYYLAGDCAAICREGLNSFADCLRCASKAL